MRPGEVLASRFEVERIAGKGGMGIVLRARDRETGRPVALKVLHAFLPDLGDRFTREAELLVGLRHPGIVGYVAHGETEGKAWLAIEWLEGEDLAARLLRGRLGIDESVSLVARLAEALGFAHARGVVHRDVKPSNVFLVDGNLEDLRILDFGIARVKSGGPALTLSGMAVGTPGYMAPEQARGEADVDARADVFALGCVLYECLTGDRAFAGEHAVAVLAKILFEEAPPLSAARPETPRAINDLLRRMLGKDRARRPRDGAEVAQAIRDLRRPPSSSRAAKNAGSPALGSGEQRIVSVVLARPDRRVIEDAETVVPSGLTRLDETAHAAAARFGATIETLFDGTAVAMLAGKDVATDQAALAARFSLALGAALPDATLALATGRAVVSGRVPVGEAIDRAASLLRAVPPDSLAHAFRMRPEVPGHASDPQSRRPPRLDEVTAGLLDARFDVRGDRRALVLHGEREVLERPRTLLGKPTACVGRERELGLLMRAFSECTIERAARAVLVKGGAGVGKSRLRHELLDRLRAEGHTFQVWVAEGDPVTAASSFGALAPALRRTAGVLEGEPSEARLAKLRARVARSLRGDDVARVTEFIGEMVNVHLRDEESPMLRAARRDPLLMGDQLRRAFLELLAAECREAPLVLVIEDLHNCDAASVKLVDAALGALHDRPFFVLALARPEVQQTFPNLWEDRQVDELRLGAIAPAAAERLITDTLGSAVSTQARAAMVTRAGGNPFFLEELVRAVSLGEGDTPPPTVLAMTEMRLSALPAELRRVLRAASVFGEVFWRGGVDALLGGEDRSDEVRAWLADLAEREIIARRGEGRFAGEDELAFRHALLREAAYGMLTDADRALGHALAGAWLLAQGEHDAGMLAAHFERGGEHAVAAVWYARAAREALDANDFEGAIENARRGLEAEPEEPFPGELALLRSEALHWSGRTREAVEWTRRAMALIPRGSARWWSAAAVAAAVTGQAGDNESVEALAAELTSLPVDPGDDEARRVHVIALARTAVSLLFAGRYERATPVLDRMEVVAAEVQAPDAQMRARAGQARGVRALYAGDPEAAVRMLRAVVEACDEAGDARLGTSQRANLGDILRQLGLYEEAERELRSCLSAATAIGLHGVTASVKQSLGVVLTARGALDEAEELTRASLAMARSHDQPRMEGISRAYLAATLSAKGELDEAEVHAEAAAESLSVAPPLRALALAIGAQVALARGAHHLALSRAREATALRESLGGLEEGEVLVRLSYAEALAATGQREAARAAIRAARDEVTLRAAKLGDPEVHASFLKVAENARVLRLSRKWDEDGA